MAAAYTPDATAYDLLGLHVLCVAGLQGGAPFKPLPGADVHTALTAVVTLGADGVFDALQERAALVYAGNVGDKGPHEIALLRKLVQLKHAHPERVILICGHRDCLKLRVADECAVVFDARDGKRPQWPWAACPPQALEKRRAYLRRLAQDVASRWTGGAGAGAGAGYRFLFDQAHGSERFVERLQTDASRGSAAPFSDALAARVRALYASLDAPIAVQQRWKELLAPAAAVGDAAPALMCVVNMVMGYSWAGGDAEPPPSPLAELTGLYIQYLQCAHIAAYFEAGHADNVRRGVVSCAGLPADYLAAPLGHGRAGAFEPVPIGWTQPGGLGTPEVRDPDPPDAIGLLPVLARLEAEKTRALQAANAPALSVSVVSAPMLACRGIFNLIALSRTGFEQAAPAAEQADESLKSDFAPLATAKRHRTDMIAKLTAASTGGAANAGGAPHFAWGALGHPRGTRIDYNIYGRSSSTLLPAWVADVQVHRPTTSWVQEYMQKSVRLVRKDDTAHVCLDVSSAEHGADGAANDAVCYSALLITPTRSTGANRRGEDRVLIRVGFARQDLRVAVVAQQRDNADPKHDRLVDVGPAEVDRWRRTVIASERVVNTNPVANCEISPKAYFYDGRTMYTAHLLIRLATDGEQQALRIGYTAARQPVLVLQAPGVDADLDPFPPRPTPPDVREVEISRCAAALAACGGGARRAARLGAAPPRRDTRSRRAAPRRAGTRRAA